MSSLFQKVQYKLSRFLQGSAYTITNITKTLDNRNIENREQIENKNNFFCERAQMGPSLLLRLCYKEPSQGDTLNIDSLI